MPDILGFHKKMIREMKSDPGHNIGSENRSTLNGADHIVAEVVKVGPYTGTEVGSDVGTRKKR